MDRVSTLGPGRIGHQSCQLPPRGSWHKGLTIVGCLEVTARDVRYRARQTNSMNYLPLETLVRLTPFEEGIDYANTAAAGTLAWRPTP